jgi:hypothetical protein
LYYEEFLEVRDCPPLRLQEQTKKAMEHVKKDHYLAFASICQCVILSMCRFFEGDTGSL